MFGPSWSAQPHNRHLGPRDSEQHTLGTSATTALAAGRTEPESTIDGNPRLSRLVQAVVPELERAYRGFSRGLRRQTPVRLQAILEMYIMGRLSNQAFAQILSSLRRRQRRR